MTADNVGSRPASAGDLTPSEKEVIKPCHSTSDGSSLPTEAYRWTRSLQRSPRALSSKNEASSASFVNRTKHKPRELARACMFAFR